MPGKTQVKEGKLHFSFQFREIQPAMKGKTRKHLGDRMVIWLTPLCAVTAQPSHSPTPTPTPDPGPAGIGTVWMGQLPISKQPQESLTTDDPKLTILKGT